MSEYTSEVGIHYLVRVRMHCSCGPVMRGRYPVLAKGGGKWHCGHCNFSSVYSSMAHHSDRIAFRLHGTQQLEIV
jgi:hypothetical protein